MVASPISDHYETKYLKKNHGLDSFMEGLMNEWQPMTMHESLNYFSGYEVCQGFTSRRTGWCREKFTEDLGGCEIGERGVGHVNHYCPNIQGAFFRHRSTRPWPESKTIVDMIFLMLKYGYDSFIMIGDSLTRQHHAELYCQLHRYGLHPQFNGTYIELRELDKYYESHPISFDAATDKRPLISSTFVINYMYLHGHASYREESQVIKNQLSLLRDASAVILFNMGLHFNGEARELQENLAEFLPFALNTLIHERKFIVFFRETSAQHFRSPSGLFEKDFPIADKKLEIKDDPIRNLFNPNNLNYTAKVVTTHPSSYILPICEPIKNETMFHEQNWRNTIALKELKKIDPHHQQIPIIPFYRLTASRHEYHINNNDCTHYCYGPMIWLPLSHRITMNLYKKFLHDEKSNQQP